MLTFENIFYALVGSALCIPVLVIVSCIWLARERRARRALEDRFANVLDADAERARVEAETQQTRAEMAELQSRYATLEARYSGVLDAEAEIERLKSEANQEDSRIQTLRLQYAEKKSIYDRLLAEVAIFDDRLAFSEMGVYEPHFDFSDSETYKAAIEEVRAEQKFMVSSDAAVTCDKQWTIDGSLAKGRTMTNRQIRLTLRAFNNECDVAIANTRWNNVNAMEKRIDRAREQLDKLNASSAVSISPTYLNLKLKELYLAHEYREKLKAEKDERAEVARLAREEQKLLRDLEQAQEEEAHYEKLLAKAKAEADSIAGAQLDAFSDQIAILERDLAEAHARAERAQAMAERTRSGYVYIISNVGSFGEDVVKIGLTRRLDPADRVRELGDASVPFVFDTHAIIYSDDAPALEHALHGEFDGARINSQNYRKEFFHVSLEAVEEAVRRLAPAAAFFKDIEAQEYRETLARRQAELAVSDQRSASMLPAAL